MDKKPRKSGPEVERKRTDAALCVSEEKYRLLFQNMTEGFALYELIEDGTGRSIDWRVLEVNDAYERHTGVRRENILGRRASEVWPEAVAEYLPIFEKVVSTGVPVSFETFAKAVGRHQRVFTFPAGGRQFANTIEDVTTRKQAEDRLARDIDAMSRLQSLGALVLREEDLRPVLEAVVDTAMAIADADFGNIQMLDPQTGDLKIAAQRGFPAWWVRFWDGVGKGHGCCGTALERGERVIIEDVERSPIFVGRPELDVQLRAGVGAVQSTPLVSRSGKKVGMFSTHHRTPHKFDEQTLRLLDLLGRQAADIIEWSQAERERREIEARLQALYASMTEGLALHEIVSTDGNAIDYTIVDVNPAFERITGLSRADVVGRRASELYGTGSAPYLEIYANVAEGGPPAVLETYFPPMRKHFSISVFSPGRGKFATVFTDVTERHAVEEALRESRAKLAAAFANMTEAIFIADAEGRLIEFNDEFVRYHRFKDRAECSRSIAECPKYLDAYFEDGTPAPPEMWAMPRALRGETASNVEYKLRRKDTGETWWGSYNFGPIKDNDGRIVGAFVAGREMTGRKRVEEALRESEERFRVIASSTPDHLLVQDRDLRYTFVLNPQLGLTEKDMIGKTDHDFLAKADADQLTALKRRVLEMGESVRVEVPLAARDGTRQYFAGSYVPKFDAQGRVDGLIGYFQDVTERKKTEDLRQALAEQERLRLGAAVEQASDAVIMIDLDGTIRYVNAAFESINLTRRSEVLTRSYFSHFAGDTMAASIHEAASAGRVWHGHVERSVSGAKPVELEITASPARNPSGAVIGVLITERDVTQENALQRQLRQSQKMEALGTLAGGISHDFNNILGAVIVNTELALLDIEPSHPGREPLPAVLQAAHRGKELVKQIITFSRQAEWERKAVEVAPVLREALSFLRPTLPGNVALREAIADDPMTVLGDPSQIHQVVVNLCQNSILAMPSGGDLKIGLAPVDIAAATAGRDPLIKSGPYVRLTVADTGQGMSREVKERIFEPFFTTRKPGGGSGLGLAVVHGIVRSYKGVISVDSEPGRGTEFNIYIPRVVGDPLPAGVSRVVPPATGRERILLVEDETAQLASLAQGLTKLGYRVTAQEDCRSALEVFRQSPTSFDLVVTDQTMPKMSGLELAAELTRIRPGLPIILYTGFSEKVSSDSLAKSGVREFLMKPFTLLEISQLIAKALKNAV